MRNNRIARETLPLSKLNSKKCRPRSSSILLLLSTAIAFTSLFQCLLISYHSETRDTNSAVLSQKLPSPPRTIRPAYEGLSFSATIGPHQQKRYQTHAPVKENLLGTKRREDRLSGFAEFNATASSGTHNVTLAEKKSSSYCYCFIIGSVHEHQIAYKGFLYNVLISVSLLRQLGSTADYVVYLQLSPSSELSEAPEDDLRLLQSMGIKVIFLPKPVEESFLSLMLSKFEVLKLTQYRRVIYLDSDVLPLSNLDYLFKLSDPIDNEMPTILQPNVMQASSGEPANGAMFLVEPFAGAYNRLLSVIEQQREEGQNLPFPNFDKYKGWGHSFVESEDEWHAVNRNGSHWEFHGGFADQGLLYYFLKYELQRVSGFVGKRVENWIPSQRQHKPGETGSPILAGVQDQLLLKYAPTPLISHFSCQLKKRTTWDYKCFPPYRDFTHFFGRQKPWQNPLKPKWFQKPRVLALKGRSKLWFVELRKLNDQLNMGLDIENWNTKYLPLMKESPLGYLPLHEDGSPPDEAWYVAADATDDFLPNEISSTEMSKTSPAKIVYSKTTTLQHDATSPYAYSFIIGSIHESRPAYKGFLYNVLLSVEILKELGSRADFVVYMQLSPDSSLAKLPIEDVSLLERMKVKIISLPKPKKESFADLMFDKFRILDLRQYRRVMYLDADLLPLSNLDYLFKLSDPEDNSMPNILLPNLMQASSGEPANGGLFMIHPREGAWEQVQQVIARQREEGKKLPYPNFHRGRGWGHKFRKKLRDNWHGAVKNGTNWVFHGAHADQGLLYYYMRFVLQNSSSIVGSRVENWVPGKDPETPVIGNTFERILLNFSVGPVLLDAECSDKTNQEQMKYTCYPPYRDVIHYTGRSKPWQNEIRSNWLNQKLASIRSIKESNKFWFLSLDKLNQKLGMGLNLSEWNNKNLPYLRDSPLGYQPLYTDNTNRIFENSTAKN